MDSTARHGNRSRVLRLAPALCLTVAAVSAQVPPESLPVFGAESRLVLVPFNIVSDAHFVRDLPRDAVTLFQDGKPRDFSIFEAPGAQRRGQPVELTVLFDTTTLTNVESKSAGKFSSWNREATYAWVNQWNDAESRALLLSGLEDVRISIYHFDHRQLHQLCRLVSDPPGLTAAIHRLTGPIPPEEAIPLSLPPHRQTLEQLVIENGGFKADPKRPIIFQTPSWTIEAALATLKDSFAAPERAIRLMAIFSQGTGPTTATAQDVADQAVALGVPIYPILLGRRIAPVAQGQGMVRYDLDTLILERFGKVGELTGGRAYYPGGMDEKLVSNILVVMRNQGLFQYVVGFVPDASGPPRTHRLEIKLRSNSSGTLKGGKRTAEY